MKYIKDINENFKLVDLSNSQWYGEKPAEDYIKRVKSFCLNIAMDEMEISEKSFKAVDRLMEVQNKTLNERKQEFDAIVHNCKERNMRPQYAAEVAYHTLLDGKLRALKSRDSIMGGI